MFCQLNHLLDAVMFDLCSTGAGKPRAGGVCKYRASLSFQESAARPGAAGSRRGAGGRKAEARRPPVVHRGLAPAVCPAA